MARLTYVSRSRGAHDERFVAALRHGGHEVTVAGLDDVAATGADLLVAGPLTDAAPAAVATGARVLGIAWGFDVLVETRDPAVRERAAAAVAGCVGVHVDCEAVRREVVALGADPAGVSLAPWGIDTDFFAPGPAPDGLRERHGLGPDDLVVLSTRAGRRCTTSRWCSMAWPGSATSSHGCGSCSPATAPWPRRSGTGSTRSDSHP